MQGSMPETQALFYFCKMYMLAPYLDWFPALASQKSQWDLLHVESARVNDTEEENVRNLDSAAHFAWTILEHVPEAADVSAIWLPVTLYFSGLVVAKKTLQQGCSRSHGSMQVLHLFRQKLLTLPYPCSSLFAEKLNKIAT